MPLPPTRYIDAGPGVPLANPNTAMEQGAAAARLGRSIEQVGDFGFKIGEQLRKIDDVGKLASLFTNMEKEAADFSLGLMARDDTDNWKQEYAEKAASWKQTGADAKLSPEGRAIFEQRFLNWDTDQSIKLATVQANKTIEMGRGRVSNGMAFYEGQGNFLGSRELLGDARAAGLVNSVEHEKGVMELANREAEYFMSERIKENPQEVLDQIKNKQLQPGETLEMHEKMNSKAESQLRDNKIGAQEKILNGIANGTVKNDSDFDRLRGSLGDADVAELKDKLAQWNDAGEKARLGRPEVQAENIGRISAALLDLQPDDTEGQVALQRELADLPTGEIKNNLNSKFAAAIKGETVEAKTYADFVMNQIDDAHKAGRFGKAVPVPKIATADLVKRGFLKDVGKIRRLGFTEGQAEDIATAAAKDPALGQKAFIDKWNDRDQGSVNASEIEIATAKALRLGHATVPWSVAGGDAAADEAEFSTAQRYGIAKMKMTEFLKLNPDAKKEAIDAKFLQITGEGIKAEAKRSLVPAKPARGGEADLPSTSSNQSYSVGPGNVVTPETQIKVQANAKGYLKDPAMDLTKAPLGMRNNNPTNIVYPSDKVAKRFGAIGKSTNQDAGSTHPDGGKYSQMVFATPEDGMKAGARLARSKYDSGMTTATELITASNGWTPGNHEAAANIARSMGIGPNDDLNLDEPSSMAKFLKALVIQEHGKAGNSYKDSLFTKVSKI